MQALLVKLSHFRGSSVILVNTKNKENLASSRLLDLFDKPLKPPPHIARLDGRFERRLGPQYMLVGQAWGGQVRIGEARGNRRKWLGERPDHKRM